MYEGLKHFHLLTIAISATLLSVRYAMMMANSALVEKKFFKVFPHINDTCLLLSGIGLIFITGFIPFTPAAPWLTEKITCVLAYIALGFFALKLGKNKLLRTFSFFGALGWLAMAGKVAVSKAPIFLG
ncbi:SirB2 family protein [Vibrio sp. Isolate25]|uniref:SirB2 family protein n=1 Tax=Vibrio TaxID=662 RepID=UPI001EFCFF70|nr:MULTISPECIES: SirB2 family protein [Vibrio]MCG9597202.1 SirB2 family protein [Vibrio sp. Isolate25]MCG9677889.1 SirB2 family protein [Vibrio sp. Isolate24]USD31774.1 SirB2 family protein [Vibrio sp. SCSIO 43186]USD44819.1 SirB2 family protein [Vibrio sp. SCSIO 43145]USD68897.1 SirB2 family protein [Vibrio sp. SCSIO 43139]